MITTRGTVTINVEQCKGCELCIPACRPGVLRMVDDSNRHGFAYPELREGCTACRACYDICPDFVFEVFKFAIPRINSTVPEINSAVPGINSAVPGINSEDN